MSTATPDHEYMFGTADEELRRLGFQHLMWRARAYAAWERAKFTPGQDLLDVGCGPGFALRDLSELAGPDGHVTGVDVSRKFVDHVRALGLPNVEVHHQDVQQLDVPPQRYHGAWARWVLCYLPDPQEVVSRVARSLRSGGRFVVQDYFNYAALKLAPPSAALERVVRAIAESWRIHGGDPDFGCRLPQLMSNAGLHVTHLEPIVRLARPDDLLWQWPTTFFRIFLPSLVEDGLLAEDERRAFEADWNERSVNPSAFFTTPPMIEVIGEKR